MLDIQSRKTAPNAPPAQARAAPDRQGEPPALLGAAAARPRRRHWLIGVSFLLAVILPTLIAAAYLTWTAADRYGSRLAFSIRSNQAAAPLEILGAVTQLGNSRVLTDGQVLYDFIQSQQIVETVRARLPLEAYYNRVPRDWVFSLGEDQPIEDLVDYWNRMVDVSLDPVIGILTIEARALAPGEARPLALRRTPLRCGAARRSFGSQQHGRRGRRRSCFGAARGTPRR